MGLLHAINCVALCLAPHLIYFQATPLAEYDVLKSAITGFSCQCATTFIKAVLLATFLPAAQSSSIIGIRDLIYLAVSLVDVVGLWYSLARCQHRNTSNAHKAQAVGLGWAFGDSVLKRLFPVLHGAFKPDFNLSFFFTAVQSNIVLAQSISFATVGVLTWNKKSRAAWALPLLRVDLLLHALVPTIISLAQEKHVLGMAKLILLDVVATAVLAVSSWQLYLGTSLKQA